MVYTADITLSADAEPVGYLRSVEIELSTAVRRVARTAGSTRNSGLGLRSWRARCSHISLSAPAGISDAGQNVLAASVLSGTTVGVVATMPDGEAFIGTAIVVTRPVGGEYDQVYTADVELVGVGALARTAA